MLQPRGLRLKVLLAFLTHVSLRFGVAAPVVSCVVAVELRIIIIIILVVIDVQVTHVEIIVGIIIILVGTPIWITDVTASLWTECDKVSQ